MRPDQWEVTIVFSVCYFGAGFLGMLLSFVFDEWRFKATRWKSRSRLTLPPRVALALLERVKSGPGLNKEAIHYFFDHPEQYKAFEEKYGIPAVEVLAWWCQQDRWQEELDNRKQTKENNGKSIRSI